MKIVTVPSPPIKNKYFRHVLENGHVPGVLSGAELRKRADKRVVFDLIGHESRIKAIGYALAYGVFEKVIFKPDLGRRCRVWADKDGQPVRIVVQNDNE